MAPLFRPGIAVEYWIPDLCVLEVANAMRKRYLVDEGFTQEYLGRSIQDLLALGPVVVSSIALIGATVEFANRLTAYDAAYVALAAARGLPLCTLDGALGQAARDSGASVVIPGTGQFTAWVDRLTPRR